MGAVDQKRRTEHFSHQQLTVDYGSETYRWIEHLVIQKDTRVSDDDVPGDLVEDHLVEDEDDLAHKLIVLLLSCGPTGTQRGMLRHAHAETQGPITAAPQAGSNQEEGSGAWRPAYR